MIRDPVQAAVRAARAANRCANACARAGMDGHALNFRILRDRQMRSARAIKRAEQAAMKYLRTEVVLDRPALQITKVWVDEMAGLAIACDGTTHREGCPAVKDVPEPGCTCEKPSPRG